MEQGPDLDDQRLQMLFELGAWCPESWALSSELPGEKSRPPEWFGDYDSYAWPLWMSESKRLCAH
jgi:hypothetical protein